MFDSLSGKLQNAFRNLRGLGRISETNIGDSLREVRQALLEADVMNIPREALEFARANNRNTLILDTAGRLQIDEPLLQELVRLRDLTKPQETMLVLDAATGQEAVNVATHFDKVLNITGSILTQLDGDARGHAGLSVKAVT